MDRFINLILLWQYPKGLRLIIVVLSMFFLSQSCTQEELCIEPKLVNMQCRFVQPDTGTAFKDTILKNANLYLGNDQKYVARLKSSSRTSVTMSQAHDSSFFIFQSDSSSIVPETIDTLIVRYTRNLHFISSACGYQTYFEMDSIEHTRNVLDSVFIVNKSVTNDVNKEHVRIVIKP